MKKTLLLLLVLFTLSASAEPVEIDGIYYNLLSKGNVAEVTKNPNSYSGSVTIPESVTYQEATYSVKTIGREAFWRCTNLTSITIPNSVTSIGTYAFRDCTRLTSITIPNSVTSIGDAAFAGTSLTSITIPNSVTSISSYAFDGCPLTSITIPNSVTSIGDDAFSECTRLTSITIPNSVTSIGDGAFWECTSLTSITIPNSVTSIGAYAFRKCTSLTSITIPNSVTSIRMFTFANCTNLTSITIPNCVWSIGESAFAGCPNLTDITCYRENVPSTSVDAFKDSYVEYATLHVPSSAINEYKTTEPWKNFKSIVSIEGGETPTVPKCKKPTISYQNGKLTFCSETEGADFVSEINDADIKKYYDAEVQLSVTYEISVYAVKTGYDNSDTATATLCWIDQQPQTEGIANGIVSVPSRAVLVKNEGGLFSVQGIDDGTQISVYNTNGVQAGSAISQNGMALISTDLQSGNIAIIKIGKESVKVVVR